MTDNTPSSIIERLLQQDVYELLDDPSKMIKFAEEAKEIIRQDQKLISKQIDEIVHLKYSTKTDSF